MFEIKNSSLFIPQTSIFSEQDEKLIKTNYATPSLAEITCGLATVTSAKTNIPEFYQNQILHLLREKTISPQLEAQQLSKKSSSSILFNGCKIFKEQQISPKNFTKESLITFITPKTAAK